MSTNLSIYATRRLGISLALICAAVAARPASAQLTAQEGTIFKGFARVIEGDTLDVQLNGIEVGVGLVGVKVPQANTVCGKLATAAAKQFFNSGPITFVND